jgi:hypothetical protein
MDIRGLVEQLVQSEGFNRVVNNPLAQFGTVAEPFLGATFLPERNVPQNEFTEESIAYRTVVANDSTRYSPVQLKRGIITGSMRVTLADSDIGSEFTSQDYDALVRLVEEANRTGNTQAAEMRAMYNLIDWLDATVRRPLDTKNEKMRWEAVVDAQVTRTGDNNYSETITYPNPSGQRVAAADSWSDDTYDIYEDFMAIQAAAAAKGYTINRIITSTPVKTKIATNLLFANRAGKVKLDASGTTNLPGIVSLAAINQVLAEDGLPAIELYDRQFRTQTSSAYYLKRDVMLFLCSTDRSLAIDRADLEPLVLQNTIGYLGVGRAAGQSSPGRKVVVNAFDNKPPRIEAEGWQTTLPVIQDPEAIFVIKDIT